MVSLKKEKRNFCSWVKVTDFIMAIGGGYTKITHEDKK